MMNSPVSMMSESSIDSREKEIQVRNWILSKMLDTQDIDPKEWNPEDEDIII